MERVGTSKRLTKKVTGKIAKVLKRLNYRNNRKFPDMLVFMLYKLLKVESNFKMISHKTFRELFQN